MSRSLSALLLENLDARTKSGSPGGDLETALVAALQAARAAWPAIEVSEETFLRFLAERIPSGDDLVRALASMHVVDLYLVCACTQGDERAVLFLEKHYLAQLDSALARWKLPGAVSDEAKQILRTRLFVGEPNAKPKIAEYSGRGDLRSWLRAAAVRAALRVMRKPKGQVDVEDGALQALPSPEEDLELVYLKRTYGAEFKAALAEAFGSLTSRDRNLLRQFFGHGLTVDQMAPTYRVHRATVARWIAKARDALVTRTRDAMVKRLRLRPSELSSLLRLIRSEVEVSIRGMSRAAGDPSA